MRLTKLHEGRVVRSLQTGFAAVLCGLLFFNGTSLADLAWDDKSIQLNAASDARDATAAFPFQNTGESSVTILSTKTSCGCTTATLSQTTFQPGESGQIDVAFAFGERTGKQSKTIVVTTDDPESPTTTLRLRVDIPVLWETKPRFVYWQAGDEPESKRLAVEIKHDQPIRLLEIESDNPAFTAEIEPVEEGKKYEIVVTPTPETLAAGQSVRGLLRIKTDFPDEQNPKTLNLVARLIGTPSTPETPESSEPPRPLPVIEGKEIPAESQIATPPAPGAEPSSKTTEVEQSVSDLSDTADVPATTDPQ